MYRDNLSRLFFKIKDEQIQREILTLCKKDADEYCERYSFELNGEFWLTVFLRQFANQLYYFYGKGNDFDVISKLQNYRSYYREKFDELLERENNLRWHYDL